MNQQDIQRFESTARESKNELQARIRALEELARRGNKELVPHLLELWRRPRPTRLANPVNWDPEAAERVVDLYVILALDKSGDRSLLPQIAKHVGQAGRILQGPDDELTNAAKVIRAIGQSDLVYQLITLAASDKQNATANAVRTLQLLSLPAPASGGAVSGFPELTAPVNFTINRLRQEIETIARLSNGRVALSIGVQEQIAAHDYDRGSVKRSGSLAEILTDQLDLLDLTYAVSSQGVMIVTFREAGARWQSWWAEHARSFRL